MKAAQIPSAVLAASAQDERFTSLERAALGFIASRTSGWVHAITAREIAVRLGFPAGSERAVREAIARARDEWWIATGDCVVGDPGEGFYVAESLDEIMTYAQRLTALADEAARKALAFREAAAANGFAFPERERKEAA